MIKRNRTVQKIVDLLRNVNTLGVDRRKILKLYDKVFGTRYIDATAIEATVIEMAMDIAYQIGRNDERSGRPTEQIINQFAQSVIQLVEYDEPIARIQVPTALTPLVAKVWEYGNGNTIIYEEDMPKIEDLNHLL